MRRDGFKLPVYTREYGLISTKQRILLNYKITWYLLIPTIGLSCHVQAEEKKERRNGGKRKKKKLASCIRTIEINVRAYSLGIICI